MMDILFTRYMQSGELFSRYFFTENEDVCVCVCVISLPRKYIKERLELCTLRTRSVVSVEAIYPDSG